MKIFLILFCLLALSFSCNHEQLPESFETGETKVFKAGDDYLSAVESLKFKISEIQDSRCPVDVVCIWQGEVAITINVATPVNGMLRLSTFDNQTDTLGKYSFELVEVTPHPVSNEIIRLEDYDITLQVNKLD